MRTTRTRALGRIEIGVCEGNLGATRLEGLEQNAQDREYQDVK